MLGHPQGGWRPYQELVGTPSSSLTSRAASGVKKGSVPKLGWKSSVRHFMAPASQQTTLFWAVTA